MRVMRALFGTAQLSRLLVSLRPHAVFLDRLARVIRSPRSSSSASSAILKEWDRCIALGVDGLSAAFHRHPALSFDGGYLASALPPLEPYASSAFFSSNGHRAMRTGHNFRTQREKTVLVPDMVLGFACSSRHVRGANPELSPVPILEATAALLKGLGGLEADCNAESLVNGGGGGSAAADFSLLVTRQGGVQGVTVQELYRRCSRPADTARALSSFLRKKTVNFVTVLLNSLERRKDSR